MPAATTQLTNPPRRTYVVSTRDGWDIALHRLPGAERSTSPTRPPVLLLPGYGTDHRCFLPSSHPGVGQALRAAGRDVWLLDFRGTGASRATSALAGPPSIDARVAHDLPAALEAVCETTGCERADLVGHSMGGVILYVYLSLCADGGLHGQAAESMVRRGVTIASPASFRPGGHGGLREQAMFVASRLARHMPRIPLRSIAGIMTHIPLQRPYRAHFHESNAPRRMLRRYVREMTTDLYGDELAQLALWFGSGRLTDIDGRGARRLHLDRVSAPMLLLAGSADGVVPIDGVRLAHDELGSLEKSFAVIGLKGGAHAEYGHLDLLAGRFAPVDVFPRLVRWLEGEP